MSFIKKLLAVFAAIVIAWLFIKIAALTVSILFKIALWVILIAIIYCIASYIYDHYLK